MPCFHPLGAVRRWDGSVQVMKAVSRLPGWTGLQLPCGQCVGCRVDRSRQWAARCLHEAQLFDVSSFITLTYDDDHLPSDGSLRYRDFQLFMKRLRKLRGVARFYMCGEYGELFLRPHFHACLFGIGFEDRVAISSSSAGSNIYYSRELAALWPHGYSSVGDVTFESAAYVARYVIKKVTGVAAEQHYQRVDGETGEVFWVEPEFTRMSLKPGIGREWFEKYGSDVLCRDSVIVRGKRVKVPRYYDKIVEARDSGRFEAIKLGRMERALKFAADQTPQRLVVREAVAEARLKFYKRSDL